MGWTNFIIIPSFKVAIETSRNVNEICDYEIKALDYLTNEERYDDDDMGEVKLNNLTIKILSKLVMSYEQSINLVGFESDKFLLYWLTMRGIGFDIKSEHNVNKDELREQGYVIVERDYTS